MEFGEGRTTVLVSGPNGQIKLEVENEEEFDGPAPEPLPNLSDFKMEKVEVKEEITEDEPFTRNMEEVEVKQELIYDFEETGEDHPPGDKTSKKGNRKNRPFECEICHKTFVSQETQQLSHGISSLRMFRVWQTILP
ncbi:hypothetical protein PFISCL1PPCAC_4448 [Pristionchus fissidentatus]|uniref:C2H2-type domain-containing protein n=1 Tax=Pristionchus fissidentatus TaxID=1538716 RepID=A0AAV5V3T7_9BILA|nr:hypothetical protein PFISCL1PPCAC_4448 [Pristionchus fissidentatus]